MKILNLNFSNRENNEINLKNSRNSTTSLPSLKQQGNIDIQANIADKSKILFSKVENFDSATNNQKTNCNSKSSKNLHPDVNLKISDFATKIVNLKDRNELNLNSVHHSPAESIDNWRFKNSSLKNFNKFSTAEAFYHSPLDLNSFNLNMNKSRDILEFKKKHANNIILKKKSQTKYKGKKANLLNINKYALLSSYEGNFKFRSESRVSKDEANIVSNKQEQEENLNLSRSPKKRNRDCSRSDLYNGFDSSQANESESTWLKKDEEKIKQNYPTVKNVKSLCINRADSKLMPSLNRMKEINEQTDNIKSKEDYYTRIQELTRYKANNYTTSAKNFESLSKRISVRKSEFFDFKFNLDEENLEKDQDLSQLSLFNVRKKTSRISINNINTSTASRVEENSGKKLAIFLRRRSTINTNNQDNLRRSASINIDQKKSQFTIEPKRFKSTFFVNKENPPIPEIVSPAVKIRKSQGILFNTNTQLLLEAKTISPKDNKRPSFFGINTNTMINPKSNQPFKIDLENQMRKSLRPSCSKVESIPLKKYSNKLMQTDSFQVNIGASGDKTNTIANTDYKINSLTSSCNKNPNIPYAEEDLSARLEAHQLINNQIIEEKKRQSLIYNSQNLAMLTEYEKDLIQKIKLVKNFLIRQPSYAFKSEKPNYKRIYVLQDGLTILKDLKFNGRFVDIPNKKHLLKHSSQPQRYEIFVNFLEDASREFNVHPRFNHIFTLNGNQVFDLNDLHDEERSCYVCN